jgi:WD40 repeat protein
MNYQNIISKFVIIILLVAVLLIYSKIYAFIQIQSQSTYLKIPLKKKIAKSFEVKKLGEIPKEHLENIFKNLIFSSNNQRFAYSFQNNNGKWLVVLDGKKSEEYDMVEELKFSPDGKHFAYIAGKGRFRGGIAGDDPTLRFIGKQFVIVDNKKQKDYDYIENILFSPDSKHLAYGAIRFKDKDRDQKETFIVFDGKEQKPYYEIAGIGNIYFRHILPQFSKDSKKFVYLAKDKNTLEDSNEILILNGKEIFKGFKVFNGQFTPNGDFAYIVAEPVENNYAGYNNYGRYNIRIFWDNKLQKEFKNVFLGDTREIILSPDGRNFAYFSYSNNTVYLNGEPCVRLDELLSKNKKIYETIKELSEKVTIEKRITDLLFSKDSSKLVFAINIKNNLTGNSRSYLAINCKVFKTPYEEIQKIILSPNSQRIAYIASRNNQKFVVVDDKESKYKFDDIEEFIFSYDNRHFAYIGIIFHNKLKPGGDFLILNDNLIVPIEYNRLDEEGKYLIFSTDSQYLITHGRIDNEDKERVIFVSVSKPNEVKIFPAYDNIYNLKFTSDNKHIIYNATIEKDKGFDILYVREKVE